jgi:hypothetical protein
MDEISQGVLDPVNSGLSSAGLYLQGQKGKTWSICNKKHIQNDRKIIREKIIWNLLSWNKEKARMVLTCTLFLGLFTYRTLFAITMTKAISSCIYCKAIRVACKLKYVWSNKYLQLTWCSNTAHWWYYLKICCAMFTAHGTSWSWGKVLA